MLGSAIKQAATLRYITPNNIPWPFSEYHTGLQMLTICCHLNNGEVVSVLKWTPRHEEVWGSELYLYTFTGTRWLGQLQSSAAFAPESVSEMPTEYDAMAWTKMKMLYFYRVVTSENYSKIWNF